MLGFINLNKPTGMTSHDCVAKVRRLLKIKRVGHGGTLDPAATGVLPIAVGKATRLLNYLPEGKAYRGVVHLGVVTTTDDLAGEIIATKSAVHLSIQEIETAITNFVGKIEQIPPMYSALHHDGKRLYELARAGEKVDVPSRQVEVSKIEVLDWQPGDMAKLELMINCGPGTYIRAIARDLGNLLGTGGTLASLQRTLSCGLTLAESISLETLANQLQTETFNFISPRQALAHLPLISLAVPEAKRWCQGQKIPRAESNLQLPLVRVESENGIFLGIGEIIAGEDKLILTPKIVTAS